MTTIRPSAGLIANWTFEPPVSTPISRSTAIAASRITLVFLVGQRQRRRDGDQSPVCTPIGSRFSIEQMMMQLSARSRTTSISNSFQPSTDSSISTSWIGEASRPPRDDLLEFLEVVGDAAAGAAEGEGRPDDRREADLGRAPSRASSSDVHDGGSSAIRGRSASIASLNSARSSALSIASRVGADQLDAVLLEHARRRPAPSRVLSAVWPPMVGSSASGRSVSMIFSTISGVSGSM